MGKSSKDKRDAYYRLAKEQGWRARSAFKLLQLDEEFNLFKDVTRVVDLCAAPGSWSQVLSRVLIKGEKFGRAGFDERMERLKKDVEDGKDRDREGDSKWENKPRQNVKIVAIDLQPMSPLEGITMLRADITHSTTVTRLLEALDPPKTGQDAPITSPSSSTEAPAPVSEGDAHRVDLILSDGAPDVTGLHDLDIYVQSQLLFSALSLAIRVLKPGGTFVAKIFRAADVDLIYAQLRLVFEDVTVAKPRSSRASSLEAFVVCRGFVPVDGLEEVGNSGVVNLEKLQDEGKGLKREKTTPYRRDLGDNIEELELGSSSESELDEEFRVEGHSGRRRKGWIAPFLACGDLSAYDADATYALPEGHVPLAPVQPPTAPPYKKALEERRREGGMYGKTKKVAVGRKKERGKEIG